MLRPDVVQAAVGSSNSQLASYDLVTMFLRGFLPW